jgi:hypothetical protein
MRPVFALRNGLALALADAGAPAAAGHSAYPTDGLQRGLLLMDGGAELGGEGVGFGVPVLKRGARAVFAGEAEVTRDAEAPGTVVITYVMDRAERLGGRRHASGLLIPLDLARELLALLYRRAPALRPALMVCSIGIRRLLRVQTRYEPIPPVVRVPVVYTLDADSSVLVVRVELRGLPPDVTEVVVMNELGAAYFDQYTERGGRTETGRHIGAWDVVRAPSAGFGGSGGVWFRLDRDPDAAVAARLYRGREQVRGRLAWAGFGYCFAPGPTSFSYAVRIGRSAT